MRERIFEQCRFTRSIICERVFASSSSIFRPSREVLFCRRREVGSCHSKCGKRSVLLADLCDGSLTVWEERNKSASSGFRDARSFSSLLQKIRPFLMNAFFITRIVMYFTVENVPRVCFSMDKYVIMLEYSPSLRIYSRVSRLSFEKSREPSPNIEKAIPSLHL